MGSVEARIDVTNVAFILDGTGQYKDDETVAQDAGRSGDMVAKTVMAYNPTTKKWEPWTDETASDGTQFPRAILLDTLAEADIQAGDIVGVPLLVGGVITDVDQLVFENSLALDTVINSPAGINTSAEDKLRECGLAVEYTINIDEFEN
jgi:hypothetical protein